MRETWKPYPLQVSVHHVNVMHVLQSIRGIGQLSKLATIASQTNGRITYELDTINPSVISDELIDISMIHPFRYHRESVMLQDHTNKR